MNTEGSPELEGMVVCENSQGMEVQATLLRFNRHQVAFEVYGSAVLLRLSEVLSEFRIHQSERVIYTGRAVVSNLMNTGSVVVCEATLEDSWLDIDPALITKSGAGLEAGFDQFVLQWQRHCHILSDFKLVISDMQAFLLSLRLWLEQIELGIRSSSSVDRQAAEHQVVERLRKPVESCLNPLFERFELTSRQLDPAVRPFHSAFAKRQLHPLLLCAPFLYRIFRKPLGYAGDYEMVNMILRDPQEGSSLFAKVLNTWFLSQAPGEAHRNRVKYLIQKLLEESLRAQGRQDKMRVFNLGCGPAGEVQGFLAQYPLADQAEFTLLDFNDETLAYTTSVLEEVKRKHSRRTVVQTVKKSVAQLLKGRSAAGATKTYDLVYCAGLFDYLPDRICKQLIGMFYEMLNPGGLLIATNVDRSNPIRHIMDFLFEWHLIYRNHAELAALAPAQADRDAVLVTADVTGSNVFLEIRKPLNK